ncbi:histidine phosphatase family protein [Rhodococcus sp. ACT016]|uniref:histidine phosphatase family protein n=1 Tax=Rhodococcus sp. ACT016 TaxID=3134808 RepID=UPI003D2AD126
MSAVTRLTLITHAFTDAMQAARFPTDEPLNLLGSRAVAKVDGLPGIEPSCVYQAPEARTVQTARALGLTGVTEPALRDLDCGAWAGQAMDAVAPDQLMAWLTDPGERSHGGEAVTDLVDRVGTWMAALRGRGERIAAVTHPAVVRAVVLCTLNAPAEAFWRIDIPPLTATTVHHRAPGWTLRTTAHSLIA